jgi:hypothetical protein
VENGFGDGGGGAIGGDFTAIDGECFGRIKVKPRTSPIADTQAAAATNTYNGHPYVNRRLLRIDGGLLDWRRRLRAVLSRVSQSGTICTLGLVATCPGNDSGGFIGGKY